MTPAPMRKYIGVFAGPLRESIERMQAGETSVLTPQWEAGKEILVYDIIRAANNDDVLAISLISEIAEKLGRGVGN